MRKAILALGMLASFAVGLSLEVVTYSDLNAGVMVRVKEIPVCFGFETRGVFGPFGGRYADCDI